jgi:hypothetical protein
MGLYKNLFTAPMKFASLLIDMNFIGQAEAQRTQSKDTFLLPLRGRQKKKINRYAIFFYYKCPQGLLLIVFRPLNGKQ